MSQRPYSLKVSSLSLSSIVDRDYHEGLCVAPDETKINTATPSFSDTSGILESITLSYGVFSLEVKKVFCFSECLLCLQPVSTQFLGNVTNYSYTVSLSPQYLHNPGGSDDLVTNDLQTTISVPSTAIALYSPTLTVNVPGARPVYFTTQPIGTVHNCREWLGE